ncbi:hypothetical protein [Thomasclavelia cocleata]|jgi:pyruvate-formate lyase-activating enzyme|uniref:hypothetical protein n=1 Tax=Thomasclavelia cocleata TaxID=69824 RepID=UPI0025701B10|nr:hypothetical protein [Thomasclavelia cocleata]
MKKGIVLAVKEENLNEEEIREFINFAKRINVNILGEAHYSFIDPFREPEIFSKILSELKVNTFLVNDMNLILADAYSNGKFVEALKKDGITIYHNKFEMTLENIMLNMDANIKAMLKDAVEYSLKKLEEGIDHIAVITNNQSEKEYDEFIERYSKYNNARISRIVIPEYNSQSEEMLEEIIGSNHFDRIILFDDIINVEFLGFMERMKLIYDVYFEDREDIQSEVREQESMMLHQLN